MIRINENPLAHRGKKMVSTGGSGSVSLPIEALEPKALQALYHQVTGKTETTKKDLRRNVIITDNDIANLYHKIKQGLAIYDTICEPTVTVVVKYADDVNVQYSSWERFQALRQPSGGITSEFTLKFEALIRISGTPIDQRIVINVNIDSSLPVINSELELVDEIPEEIRYIMSRNREWNTVQIEIDYVDFVLAKSFIYYIEEWFSNLAPSSVDQDFYKRYVKYLSKARGYSLGSGRLFFAITLLSFYLIGENKFSPNEIVMIFSTASAIFFISNIAISKSFSALHVSLNSKIIPSVIIIDEYDQRALNKINDEHKKQSALLRILSLLGSFVISLATSILSAVILVNR